jgi:uncharacterized protein DUF5753
VVGGSQAMGEQSKHLIEAAQLPKVRLKVLPFNAREHPFLGASAALLEFRETTHLDVVYLEGLAGEYYEEQHSDVEIHPCECHPKEFHMNHDRPVLRPPEILTSVSHGGDPRLYDMGCGRKNTARTSVERRKRSASTDRLLSPPRPAL